MKLHRNSISRSGEALAAVASYRFRDACALRIAGTFGLGIPMRNRARGGIPQSRQLEALMSANTRQWTKHSGARRDRIDYCVIYAVAFAILLTAALVQRFLPRTYRAVSLDPTASKSILAETRTATRDVVAFAFMR